jgi:hypothetical protein
MQPADKKRLLVYTTVFGVLWGILEMVLGSWLHLMHFPFTGGLMAGIGGIVLCSERGFTPVRGATLWTGFVAVLFKCISAGGFSFGPVIAIAIETVVVEAVLSLMGVNAVSFFVGPLLSSLEAVPHVFVSNWLMFGVGIFKTYGKAVHQIQAFFGLSQDLWKVVAGVWLGGHLLLAVLSGALSVKVGRYLRKI